MIGVLGDFEMVVGFSMAGVRDCLETDEKNLKENLEKIKDNEIIIISERLYQKIECEDFEEFKNIFIPVPDKHGSVGLDMVKGMIKEIIGRETEGYD